MYFTQEDYKKIENWLHRNSVKDTEFQEALPFTGKEIVTVVQDGHNRKVSIQEFINQLYKHGVGDFLNVTNTYRANNITLKEAISLIPAEARKEGQVITFLNTEGNWEIYQFTGKLNQWNNTTLWNNPFDWEKFVVDSILPDEEDLTKSAPDANGNAYLSLKNRKYEPDKYSGLGRKILRRRVVEIEDPIYGTQEKNLLLQADFAEDNTVYVVRYDFTLNGQDITLPDNSYIEYEGGSISDGNIIDRAGGLNRVILKKNIINGKNILTQDMVSTPNTIYEIRYDFTLGGDITIPENCVLEFNGGSISGNSTGKDTITGQNTCIQAELIKIFNTSITFDGTWNIKTIYPQWFGAKGDGITNNTDSLLSWLEFPVKNKTIPEGIYNTYELHTPLLNGCTIIGYRATLKYVRLDVDTYPTSHGSAVLMNKYDDVTIPSANHDGEPISIYGLTIDGNKDNLIYNPNPSELTAIWTAGGMEIYNLKSLTLIDCTIKNTFMHGVLMGCVDKFYADRCTLLNIAESENYHPIGTSYSWEGFAGMDAVWIASQSKLAYLTSSSFVVCNSYFENISGSYASAMTEHFESYGNTIINNKGYLHEFGGETNDVLTHRIKRMFIDIHNNYIDKCGGSLINFEQLILKQDTDITINFNNNVITRYRQSDIGVSPQSAFAFSVVPTLQSSNVKDRVKISLKNNKIESKTRTFVFIAKYSNVIIENNVIDSYNSNNVNEHVISTGVNSNFKIISNTFNLKRNYLIDTSINTDAIEVIKNNFICDNLSDTPANVSMNCIIKMEAEISTLRISDNLCKGLYSLLSAGYNGCNDIIINNNNTNCKTAIISRNSSGIFTKDNILQLLYKNNIISTNAITTIVFIDYKKGSDAYPTNGNIDNKPNFIIPENHIGFLYIDWHNKPLFHIGGNNWVEATVTPLT